MMLTGALEVLLLAVSKSMKPSGKLPSSLGAIPRAIFADRISCRSNIFELELVVSYGYRSNH
jgi:hypothetical protein